jgi:hypothetical protein
MQKLVQVFGSDEDLGMEGQERPTDRRRAKAKRESEGRKEKSEREWRTEMTKRKGKRER